MVEWRIYPHCNRYEVSNDGQVRRASDGRPIKTRIQTSQGYLEACLFDGKKNFRIRVHRLVALTFLGNPPSRDYVVAHADGDRANPRVENLRWATMKQNYSDRLGHGTILKGCLHPTSKLSAEDEARICEASLFGAKRKDLASVYGINPSTIISVLQRHGKFVDRRYSP